MRNLLIITAVIIVALALILLGLRIFSGEDVWICKNGQWTKHGNPTSQMPTKPCK